MTAPTQRKYVVRVRIQDLFGQYSYDLKPKAEGDSLSQLFLLYGENGTGKTKILWLLNHLLSKETGEGHRSFLAKTQFKELAVYLNDGTVISAMRSTPTVGNFRITLDQGSKTIFFDYKVNERGIVPSEVTTEPEHGSFHNALPDLRITILPDDRKVNAERSIYARRLVAARETPDFLQYVHDSDDDKDPSALEPALTGLRSWATTRALEGSNLGQRDVNAIYADLLKRLSQTDEHSEQVSVLLDRLNTQGERSAQFSRFGLSSVVDVGAIIKTFSDSQPSRQQIMTQVIKPYLDSNEARFAALDSLRGILTTFVDELNIRFFKHKNLSFDLGAGVQITSNGSKLDPKVLSSGERQLLVLFCNVAQASDRDSIFIIDEPELSLNVDWQRNLISALQKLAAGNIQFIFATHSLELLARHRPNVAELIGKTSEGSSPVQIKQETQE